MVVEDEAEETYIQTGKEKKKALQLADLTPEGQELFEQLRKCRTELGRGKRCANRILSVPIRH